MCGGFHGLLGGFHGSSLPRFHFHGQLLPPPPLPPLLPPPPLPPLLPPPPPPNTGPLSATQVYRPPMMTVCVKPASLQVGRGGVSGGR